MHMVTLFHQPLDPHSRFARLMLGEYGLAVELEEERAWERRAAFLALNPAGTLPVLQETTLDGRDVTICGIMPLAEYLDETRGSDLGSKRLLPGDAVERAEMRRLLDWFNRKFYEEVGQLLVHEKLTKRDFTGSASSPDMNAIRAAQHNIRYHLRYIGYLISQRPFLAGDWMTYADLAAAAQLSTIDYFGDVPWDEDEGAKIWYARIKSRPSFRPLLADLIAGMPPPSSYADLDF